MRRALTAGAVALVLLAALFLAALLRRHPGADEPTDGAAASAALERDDVAAAQAPLGADGGRPDPDRDGAARAAREARFEVYHAIFRAGSPEKARPYFEASIDGDPELAAHLVSDLVGALEVEDLAALVGIGYLASELVVEAGSGGRSPPGFDAEAFLGELLELFPASGLAPRLLRDIHLRAERVDDSHARLVAGFLGDPELGGEARSIALTLLRFHASLHPESATAIHTVLLDEGDAAVRAVAIQILGSIDPEGWEDRFAADYPFVEAAEQEAIASTLAAHLPAERAARLLQELHDVVPAKPLVNAWSHLGSRDSGIILDRFTREPDPHARKEMLTGFFSDTVGPEEAVRFFSAVIDGEVDRGVVTQAILMLGTVDHDEARALIARNIDDPRWRDGIGDALFNSIPSAPDRFLRERVIPWYRAHILGTPLATAGRCERWRRAVALRAPELLGEMEP